jgi:hypothetical protein
MTRTALAIILTAVILIGLVGTQFTNQIKANPHTYDEYYITNVPPPGFCRAPIEIQTPQNGSYYPRNNIPLIFNVTILPPDGGNMSINWIQKLFYVASWEPGETQILEQRSYGGNLSFSLNLLIKYGGNLSLTIYAVGAGEYETKREPLAYGADKVYVAHFEITNSSTVNFNQDFGPPEITVLSPQNSTTYDTSDVALNLTASEALSQTLYCLGVNQNESLTQNTTLIGLTNGAQHNRICR